MKRFISILILIFCYAAAISQCGPPQKVGSNYQFKAAGADTVQRLPNGLPSLPCWLSAGDIFYSGTDSNVYIWTGTQALPVDRPALPLQGVQWNHGGHFAADTTFKFDTLGQTVYSSNQVIGKASPGQFAKTLLTQRLYDSSWVTLQHYPTLQIFGDFYRGLDQTFINTDGQRDASLFDCYNCNAPGAPVATGEIEMDRTIESHFVPTGSVEIYDQFVYPNGDRVRPFGYLQPYASADGNELLMHFDQNNFFDERGGINLFSFRNDGHFRMIGKIPECTLGLNDSATGAGIFVVVHSDVNLGTQISSASDATHFAPTSVYWGLNVQGSLNEAVWSIETAASPTTYNMSQDTTNYLVDPTALLPSFAYILPGLARDGQVIDIYAGGQIGSGTVVTSFSVVANVGFGQTLISNVSLSSITLSAGQHFRLKFQALNSRWYNSN